jgi:penicillin-binding protein 1C
MRRFKLWAGILLFLVLLAAGVSIWLFQGLPSVDLASFSLNLPSVRITDRQGRLLYEMLAPGGGGGRNAPTPLERIPLALKQATIATEDASFYTNPGVDPLGIIRALWINLQGGETLSGGSTITQQVARGLLMSPQERLQRTLRRKLRESILAWQLTQRYSKDEILAFYLNQTYYGGMAYGVEAAAQTYFGKSASDLDLAECAMLAGLPQAPSLYDPFTDLDAAKKRQAVVLGLMQKAGYLDAGQVALAEREPLVLAGTPYPLEAPHFVMMVRAQIDALFTPDQVMAYGGLVVRTTLDLDDQKKAEQAVADQLERLHSKESGTAGHNLNDAALVALDPHTGQILAMVGSADYNDRLHAGAVNMALAPRQPGSALKPFIYALAFDPARPDPWTAASMLLDVSTHFVTHDQQPYTPVDYDGQEHGPVLARAALASSLNIPAVLTLDHVGLPALFDLAGRLGMTSLGDPDHSDLSLALGGGDVRLLDLTAAYAALATGGLRVDPQAILEVSTTAGQVVYTAPDLPARRVLDERVTWLVSDILSDDNARLLGFQPNSVLRLDRPAAVKTGTTSDFHDNWTVGYTPDLVVGVWAGNANHEAMRDITGLTGAAPIWAETMRAIMTGTPETPFARPAGLVQVEVCSLSGLLPTPACPYRRLEWFIDGTQPTQPDTFYRTVAMDAASALTPGGPPTRLADAATPPERRVTVTALDLPPQAGPWAHGHGLLLLSDLLPPGSAGASTALPGLATPQAGQGTPSASESPTAMSQAELSLVSPADLTTYQISPGLPLANQQIRLLAVGAGDLTRVTLYVDGQALAGLDAPPYQAWWPLSAGAHEAWATGARPDGTHVESAHVRFTVKP